MTITTNFEDQGHSWTTFDTVVSRALQIIQPKRILDIGAGQGKYGQLIRRAGLATTEITALECDPHLNKYLTQTGYNHIKNMTAQQLFDASADQYEVVIMGDIIEHMKHSEGQDLLEFLNYRCSYIFIITPEVMPMSHPVFFVGHNSAWPPRAMTWHDWFAYCTVGQMHLYVVRGLLDWQAKPLNELVNQLNTEQIQVDVPNAVPPRTGPATLTISDQRITQAHPDQPGWTIYFRPT